MPKQENYSTSTRQIFAKSETQKRAASVKLTAPYLKSDSQ